MTSSEAASPAGESSPGLAESLESAADGGASGRTVLNAALDVTLGGDSILDQVVRSCELPDPAARVLALVFHIEVDESLQSVVERMLGAPGARRATVGLLARVLGADVVSQLTADAPLSRAELLQRHQDGQVFTDHTLGLDPQVVLSLLGDTSLDPALPLGTTVLEGDPRAPGVDELTLVHGPDRIRRLQAAIQHTLGIAFLVVPEPRTDEQWRAVVRQAGLLAHTVILEVDGVLGPEGRHHIERTSHLAWSVSSPQPQPLDRLPRRPWTEVAAGDHPATDTEIAALLGGPVAEGRRLSATQLWHAADALTSLGNTEAALARLSAGPLSTVLQRRTPRATWDDLVLPQSHTQRLRDLAGRFRNRRVVHDTWGLAEHPSPGLVCLFTGPSGTGKTLSAEVIAHELGVDLLRVDLQSVVSKYIGETEKNLEQVFGAASAGNDVLLFDEADALFGSRSKVSDARDRYANLEVSYLLQRLEIHPGLVVLTTNFAGNIDQAFTRRIHASVHFQLPSPSERERIWRRSLAQAPLGTVDLTWAAESFDLSGGSIRNAALSTAYLAASEGEAIEQRHLVGGIVQELVKLGRRPSPDLFGPYAPLVVG